MDYERIHKPSPQGGGISPSKLRAMLLGVEKKRKEEEEELEALSVLRSDPADLDDRRFAAAENFRDVDVVSSLTQCSASIPAASGQRAKPRAAQQLDEDSFEVESVSSAFEFQRAERAAPHRAALMPLFLKPAPSKWDDAQKWIASPTASRPAKAGSGGGAQARKPGLMGYGSRQAGAKVVMEVVEEIDTKRVDPSQAKREAGGGGGHRATSWVPENRTVVDSGAKNVHLVENLVSDPATILSRHDSSASVHSGTTIVTPPSTVKSVSMRDMGTEMTPIASQEPSRTGTPARETTPKRSPNSSRPPSPGRNAPSSTSIESAHAHAHAHGEPDQKELSEKELQMKTRREIMVLGTQLGKLNIAAWASKEVEELDASVSLKPVPIDQPTKSGIETRAAAWEEAEKAKYLARFKQEEIKIQAWENHQKAKTEAEMRKIEVEVEKMRARAHDRLMSKLAAARHKAEEKRAAAEAMRNQQAARTAKQAEYIRRTGQIPSSCSCWSWCP